MTYIIMVYSFHCQYTRHLYFGLNTLGGSWSSNMWCDPIEDNSLILKEQIKANTKEAITERNKIDRLDIHTALKYPWT